MRFAGSDPLRRSTAPDPAHRTLARTEPPVATEAGRRKSWRSRTGSSSARVHSRSDWGPREGTTVVAPRSVHDPRQSADWATHACTPGRPPVSQVALAIRTSIAARLLTRILRTRASSQPRRSSCCAVLDTRLESTASSAGAYLWPETLPWISRRRSATCWTDGTAEWIAS